LLGTTLILPGMEDAMTDPELIRDALQKQVELVIDGGACSLAPTSVIDLSGDQPVLIRRGRGDIALFGL
jgi:tRNA A37 threonylcarbamoyladenosine synthetase subunit TsaC/SUA5/YrdC